MGEHNLPGNRSTGYVEWQISLKYILNSIRNVKYRYVWYVEWQISLTYIFKQCIRHDEYRYGEYVEMANIFDIYL